MATDIEIERALATVTATLHDQGLEQFDTKRVQPSPQGKLRKVLTKLKVASG